LDISNPISTGEGSDITVGCRSGSTVMLQLKYIIMIILMIMPACAELNSYNNITKYSNDTELSPYSNIGLEHSYINHNENGVFISDNLSSDSINYSNAYSDMNFTDVMRGAVDLGPSIIGWQKCLGGNAGDVAQSVQQTSDGGYIIAGYTESNDGDVSGYLGSLDAWVVKLDANHAIQWQRCLGTSTSSDYAYNIRQTADGGYIFAGSVGYSAYDIKAWVAKLSSSGDMEWQKYFGEAPTANSIHQTADGGYIVAGRTHGTHGSGDFWVAKLAPNGAAEWQKTLGGNTFDEANSVQQTSDGGYVIAGYAQSNDGNVNGNHGGSDLWVVKLNSGGDMLWQKCLGGSDNDVAASIQQTTDDGYIIAGFTRSNNGDVSLNQGSDDYWVVKIDSEGTIQWQRCLGGSSADYANSVRQTSDGGYVVAGYSYSNDGEASYNHGIWDFLVVKLEPNGATEWYKCLGGSLNDQAYGIQQTADGGYIVAGSTESNDGDVSGNRGASDFWVAKIAPTTPPTNPTTPSQPLGPASGMPGVSYIYSTSATDPNGDQVKYTFDWGDGSTDTTNLVDSGTTASASHAWSNPGTYQIKAKATDGKGASSGWSLSLAVEISESNNNNIEIDESASDSWIDPYSSNTDDKEARIWYEIAPYDFSGQLEIEIKDENGKPGGKVGPISVTGGRHSLTWDGRISNEYVNQANNPYYISLILKEDEKEVARSANQRIWVGRPVILLHGIFSSKEEMEKTDLYDELSKSFYISSIEYDGGIIGSSTGDIKQYAGKLSDEIESIKQKTCAKKIDIVAHSMGGLVARYHIQRSETGVTDVGKLIMIGTPNHGSDFANLPRATLKALINIILDELGLHHLKYSIDSIVDQVTSNFAVNEMIPHHEFLKGLNGNDCCAHKIMNGDECNDRISTTCQYSVITSEPTWVPTLTHKHSNVNIFGYDPLNVFWVTAGDGVVPFFSSKLSDVSISSEGGSFHPNQANSQDIIAKVKSLLQQTTQLARYDPTLFEENELDASSTAVYWTNPIEDIIQPGDRRSYNILVDPSSIQAHFMLVWDNGTLNVTLSAPNGTEIEIPSKGNAAFYSVQSPDPGNWTAEILPISIPANGTNVTIQAFIESPLFIGVNTAKATFDPQEPINITAYVGDNQSGFAEALVVAKVSKPDNTTETLTLYDDGLHNDNGTRDGIYANQYMNTSLWGTYRILISASGNMDGNDFERQIITTVWVELYPDLTLNTSEICFSNSTPIAGENVILTAEIHNIGDTDAWNSSILFYGSSLFQVGRLNCNFPSLRYIINMRFLVVLKPLALLFAD
jgi:pimeloyl-ACP methyl ester carboxylesterase